MIKCNGREAISILAEVEAGKRPELTKGEEAYVRMQANSFVVWLTSQGKTREEAKEIALAIFNSELKLLTAEDPYADHIWSRGDEVGETEITGMGQGMDFEKASDEEHQEYERFWAGNHLERHEGKYSDEQWKASQDKLDRILEVLKPYQEEFKTQLTLSSKSKAKLRKANARLNELRYKNVVLMYRHWAQAKNIINELLGLPKRYTIKEIVAKTEDEKVDAMDMAIYGYFDNNQLYS